MFILATEYGLYDRMIGVQTGSGVHPAFYPMDTEGSFAGGKSSRGVKMTTRLHLVTRSKNTWRYTYTPQYAFMAWCLVKHRDNFTFTLFL
jgi:hypothetical protein